MQPYNKKLKQLSRDLRNNMTDAELLLWSKLRRKQILGLQFYRQKPILNYIVDFYCPAINLVIECDGGQHYTDEGLEADRIRDEALTQQGLVILRFDNGKILLEIDSVISKIFDVVSQHLESPFDKGGPAVNWKMVFDLSYSSLFNGRLGGIEYFRDHQST